MGRPHIEREVEHPPLWRRFIPEGEEKEGRVILHLDEYEAVRLSDYMGFSHKEAADKMGVSRSTFTRLIGSAHKKIGEAVTLCKEIYIQGGTVHFRKDVLHCDSCGNDIYSSIDTSYPYDCPSCGASGLRSLGRQFRRRRMRGRKFKGGFNGRKQE